MNNLNVYKDWAKGFVEEVLNGEEYMPTGVCPHQCWSETMVLQPILEGMLGLKPSAPEGKLQVAPAFPSDWNFVKVKNIKIGTEKINFEMKRDLGKTLYSFKKSGGKSLNIDFLPSLPKGTVVKKVLLDGKEIDVVKNSFQESEKIETSFSLNEKSEIEILTEGGISVIPSIVNPHPGSESAGFRVISSLLEGNSFNIKVESKSKSEEILKVFSANKILEIEGGEIMNDENGIYTLKIIFEEKDSIYQTKNIVLKTANG